MLTDKQQKFCDQYLIDLNATQAAIRAGYSKKTAGAIGSEYLTKPNIQKYISEKQAALSKSTEITQIKVLEELAKVGFSNIQDYFDGSLNALNLAEIDKSKAQVVSSIKKIVTTFDGGSTESVEFKLYDKIKALELIGRHLGFFEKDNGQSRNVINVVAPSKK